MNGLGKLIGNELYKLWKQTFVRVIAIIVLSIIVIYPFLLAGLDYGVSALISAIGGEGVEDDLAYYEEEAEWYAEAEMPLDARYYTVCADSCRYFVDAIGGDESREWVYEAYGESYLDLLLGADAMRLVASGQYSDDELRDSYYAYVLTGTYFLEGDYGAPDEVDPAFDPEEYLAWCEENIAYTEERIENTSVEEYLTDTVELLELQITYAEGELLRIEKELEGAPDDGDLLLGKSNLERYIAWEKDLLRGYQLLSEKGYGPGTWQYTAVNKVLSGIVYERQVSLPVSEREFESDEYYFAYYDSYEEYVEECEMNISISDEPMTVILHAVEHNVPLPYLAERSSKLAAESFITATVQLVFYLALAIGGTIVATEHSRGTIRLLLIRPRTRTKILWSKLLAAVIVMTAFSLFAFLWSVLWSLILYGGSDFFVPTLFYTNGEVLSYASVISYLGIFFGALLQVLFFLSVAFFFSVACKKTVLAIVLTFAVNGTLNAVCSIVLTVWSYTKLEILKYLPFAYADLTMFGSSVTDYYCSVYGNEYGGTVLSGMLGGASGANMTSGLLPAVGALWFILLGALLVFFSILIFKRRQIKD